VPGAVAVVLVACLLASCGGDETVTESTLSPVALVGEDLAEVKGCANCHAVTDRVMVGPSWKGVWGEAVPLSDGTTAVFDEEYVVRSVREPAAQRRAGDWILMPVYPESSLTDDELASIVAYVREVGAS
jgi:cytochrome c oxidase subunit 2